MKERVNDELLNSELKRVKSIISDKSNLEISDSSAFGLLMCALYCRKDFDLDTSILLARDDNFTDGTNDGGVDFVYYDDEINKVVIAQCKNVKKFKPSDLIIELNKMSNTLENFKSRNTGIYNSKLCEVMQNALDSLPPENAYNVEYQVFVSCDIDEEKFYCKIDNEHGHYTREMVSIFSLDDISSKIDSYISDINTVKDYKIRIDKANNRLEYNTDKYSGIMVNLSSYSLIDMYNKFKNKGLFDLNIRKYVANKQVDNGIRNTIEKERENFWFLNNGVIIVCEEYVLDGNMVKLNEFSIVNGGQTTNRIGEFKGSNEEEFFIPCKIIEINKEEDSVFYNKIAETSNSQKPINPRDLKSNRPEMLHMKHWLESEGINLEIKRGERKTTIGKKIKNDELGQLILSFVHQQPGTARSGKKFIFDNDTLYNKIFHVNYEKDPNKKAWMLDLIRLYINYSDLEKTLKLSNCLNEDERNVLSNGKCVIFSIFGLLYRYVNKDIEISELIDKESRKNIDGRDFHYAAFISNYRKDDYQNRLKELVMSIVEILCINYVNVKSPYNITSISNFFKTDAKYRELIIETVAMRLRSDYGSKTLLEHAQILKRSN